MGAERVVDETLCGQLGAVEVAAGHTGTTNVEFSDDTDRYRLKLLVEDVDLGIRHRLTDVVQKASRSWHGDPG